jgi:hypothetical protein
MSERRASTRLISKSSEFSVAGKKSAKRLSNGYDPRLFSSKKNNVVQITPSMNHGVITSDIIAWAGSEVPNIETPRVAVRR